MSIMRTIELFTDTTRTTQTKHRLTTPTPFYRDLLIDTGYYEPTPVDTTLDAAEDARLALERLEEAAGEGHDADVLALYVLIAAIKLQAGNDGRVTRRVACRLAAMLTANELPGPDGQPRKVWTRKEVADLMPWDWQPIAEVLNDLEADAMADAPKVDDVPNPQGEPTSSPSQETGTPGPSAGPERSDMTT